MIIGIHLALNYVKGLVGLPPSPLTTDFTLDGDATAPSCYTINSGVCLEIADDSCLELINE